MTNDTETFPSFDLTSESGRTYRFDGSDYNEISVALVESLSAVEGVDPLSLQPKLNDHVDADALEELITDSRGEIRIRFSFSGCDVIVTDGKQIFIRDPNFR